MRTITVSFKNNADDDKLYEWILSHNSYSGFIKDMLRRAMEEENIGTKMNFAPLHQILKQLED